MTDVADIVQSFQSTMWLPDPGIVYAVLGTVAANRLPGDPLWLLLVGPPSSGKTEVLDALSELPEYHAVSTFTEAGLLSGSPTRDGAATGGLLLRLGDRGLIVAPDFGTLLNEHGSTRNRMFACLREVFDGKFVRRLGTSGGRTFKWQGHVGFLGAVTEAIDSPKLDLGLLGERFTYYRMPPVSADDDFIACCVADDNAGHQREIRAQRSAAVNDLFANFAIPDDLPPFPDEEDRLITLSVLGARCRSSVVRDGYTREIDVVPGHERSPRLFGQLRQLAAGLTVIGTPESEIWRLLAKTALDGMHPGRRTVIEYLLADGRVHSTSSVAGHCRLPETTTRRHLQDLMAHGVVDFDGVAPERWVASQWLRESWWSAAGRHPVPDESIGMTENEAVAAILRAFPGAVLEPPEGRRP